MGKLQKTKTAYLEEEIPEFEQVPTYIDLVAFSQLRWNFVWQRPQHLMSRWARSRRVFFVEEPIFGGQESFADVSIHNGVHVVVPHLRDDFSDYDEEMKRVIDHFFHSYKVTSYILWYWTPMALGYSRHFLPQVTIYDCMDELSAFASAPPQLKQLENELMARADLVFTGGESLYEARRYQHPNIHAFPSSIDAAHFNQARFIKEQPPDQKEIGYPRIGFFGVIDERMDIELVRSTAQSRPDWQIIMIGPTAKISPEMLPRDPNIHYLGQKKYEELPFYLSGWNVAILPFARNEATRYISPTKTPEYLAAGRPVVSTSIRDVVRPYGEMKLVHIADTADEFIAGIERAIEQHNDKRWLMRVDAFLEGTSWDRTWNKMNHLISLTLKSRWLKDDYRRRAYVHPLMDILAEQEVSEDV